MNEPKSRITVVVPGFRLMYTSTDTKEENIRRYDEIKNNDSYKSEKEVEFNIFAYKTEFTNLDEFWPEVCVARLKIYSIISIDIIDFHPMPLPPSFERSKIELEIAKIELNNLKLQQTK